ncbi:MAG: cell wall hydrolase [Xanthobacteraceae bacterium]
MIASRTGPKGAGFAPFGLASLVLLLTPAQPGVERPDALVASSAPPPPAAVTSAFGTIHAATFSFPRPVGTTVPEPPRVRLASLSTSDLDVTGAIGDLGVRSGRLPSEAALGFPLIDRTAKGDFLASLPRHAGTDDEIEAAARYIPFPEYDISLSLELHPQIPRDEMMDAPDTEAAQPDISLLALANDPDPNAHTSRLFFGDLVGSSLAGIVPWTPGEEPILMMPHAPDTQIKEAAVAALPDPAAAAPTGNGEARQGAATAQTPKTVSQQPDISLLAIANDPDASARTSRLFFGDLAGSSLAGIATWAPSEEPILTTPGAPDNGIKHSVVAVLPAAAAIGRAPDGEEAHDSETIAGKGVLGGAGQRPKSPAERLGLSGQAREKAEKCLANAVYFESRGEAVRGQIAVAQVVLNRSFSGYYPNDVCGVVYQNARRHLACQFTFACDGIPDVVTEQDAWDRATRIAKATLDGKVWLPEIGKATHYHAYWVHPWWVRTMRKLTRIGVHSFYRPRRWGDGEGAPSWGSAAAAADMAAKL